MFSSAICASDSDDMIDSTASTDAPAYSFEALCVPLYQDMVNFARRLAGGDHARAADVVQTSFVKALEAWHRWQPDGDVAISARAWLYRIVANTYMKAYRAACMATKRAQTLSIETTIAIFGRLGEDGRDRVDSEYGDEVTEALGSLSDEHRTLIDAYYVRELSCSEISSELGIEKGTVFSRLARARAALEAALSGFAEDNYGLRRRRPRSPKREASGSGVDLRKPTKRPKANTCRVERIVCELDGQQLESR